MKKSTIAIGVATALAGGAAQATTGGLTLTTITTGSANGPSNAINVTGTSYAITGTTITQLSAMTHAEFDINPLPNNELFTHEWSGMVLDGAGGGSVTAYQCIEGTFGGNVGASLCGNYNWGTDFVNSSSTNYNVVPGTRSIGGDDVAVGPQQQGSDYNCTVTVDDGFVSGNVVCQTAAWIASPTLAGTSLTFHIDNVVPVPAAVWLFGSALGLLGWARRRA